MYYFAYGSNLDTDQMAERCPAAEAVGKALLPNYTLAFGGHSPNWDGAPATIVDDEQVDAPGLLYEIDYREIRLLDKFEGHPVRYERCAEQVLLEDGGTREAQVYIKHLEGNYGLPPESYLSVLDQAYRELGFDRDILEHALALGTDDSSVGPTELLAEMAAQPA
jgi:cation transport regulator ChaC